VNRYGSSAFDEGVITQSFWEQIKKVEPLDILGAGTPNMFFLTRHRHTFDRVKKLYVVA
jgi:hypothetical protein